MSPPETNTLDQDEIEFVIDDNSNRSPSTEAYPGKGHLLSHKPVSATSIWNEWHGLEDFQDIPVPGGIPTMEKEHKTDWRKGYNWQKRFSRWNTAIKAMKKIQLNGDKSHKDFLQSMEVIFLKHPSITSFSIAVAMKANGNTENKE